MGSKSLDERFLSLNNDSAEEEFDFPAEKKPCCCGRCSKKRCFGVCFCTTLVLLTLIMVTLVYAVLPKLAQDDVNSSSLSFQSISILNPSSSSFTMDVAATLHSDSDFDCDIDATTVQVLYQSVVLTSIDFPALSVKKGTDTMIHITTTFNILSMDQFNVFSSDLIRSDAVSWQLLGKLSLHAKLWGMSLPAVNGITFDKTVPLQGMGGLKDVNVTSADPTESTATNIIVHVQTSIYNPSVITLDPLGDLTLQAFYKGFHLGTLTATALSLVPGMNKRNFTAVFNPHPSNDTIVTEAFSRLLSGEAILVDAFAGPHSTTVPLFNAALTNFTLHTYMSIAYHPLVTRIDVSQSLLSLNASDISSFMMSLSAQIGCYSPLGTNSPIDITLVMMDADMLLINEQGKSVLMSHTTTPYTAGDYNGATQTLTVSTFSLVHLLDDQAFSEFAYLMTTEPSVHIVLDGTVSVHLTTVAGPMILEGLPLNSAIELRALNDLHDVTLNVTGLTVSGGQVDGLMSMSNLTLFNPAPVGIDLGNSVTHLQILYTLQDGTEVVMGHTDMSNFKILTGVNYLTDAVYLTRSAQYPGLLESLLSNYLSGNDTAITVVGRANASTPFPYLDRAVAAMRLPTVIPGQRTPLITHAQVRVGLEIGKELIPTKLTIHNVFDVAIEIVSANTLIYYNDPKAGDELIARLVQPFNAVVVPSQKVIVSAELPIEITGSNALAIIKALLKASSGGVLLDVTGYLGFAIQQFNATIFYTQRAIDTQVCSLFCPL